MADVTVKQLADVVGTSLDRLLEQLHGAGLTQKSASDIISDHDKLVLLSYLRDSGVSQQSKSGANKDKNTLKDLNEDTGERIYFKHSISDYGGKLYDAAALKPKVFISYSYDSPAHIKWVEQLATMLRTDGVDTTLDRWFLHPGDPITEFMEKGIRDSEFVLIICTEKYKNKSDARTGGVGYEEAIISSDMFTNSNHRKYIPILKSQNSAVAIPTTLHSKLYINLSDEDDFSHSYRDLLLTLYGRRPTPPPIGEAPDYINP